MTKEINSTIATWGTVKREWRCYFKVIFEPFIKTNTTCDDKDKKKCLLVFVFGNLQSTLSEAASK